MEGDPFILWNEVRSQIHNFSENKKIHKWLSYSSFYLYKLTRSIIITRLIRGSVMRLPTFTAAESLYPAQGSYRTKFSSSATSYLAAQAQYYANVLDYPNVSIAANYQPGSEDGQQEINTILGGVVNDPNLRQTSLGKCLRNPNCYVEVEKGIHPDRIGEHITVSYSNYAIGDFKTPHVWVKRFYDEYLACAVGDYYAGGYSDYVQRQAMTFAQDCSEKEIAQS